MKTFDVFLALVLGSLCTTACFKPTDDDDDIGLDETEATGDSGTEDESTEDSASTESDTQDTDSDPTDETGCQPGTFDCMCDAGTCEAGLECVDGVCQLGGGTETETGDDTDTGDGGDWDPATCEMPSQVLMVGDLPGNFCSSPCMSDADCPPGTAETQPACALTTMAGADPSFCALICQTSMDSCPTGSTCKDLMDPNNPGIGLCTFP